MTISIGELAALVRELLSSAEISFDNETGGREESGLYLMDNSRLVDEFGVQYRPFRERVVQTINEVRADAGLPLVQP